MKDREGISDGFRNMSVVSLVNVWCDLAGSSAMYGVQPICYVFLLPDRMEEFELGLAIPSLLRRISV